VVDFLAGAAGVFLATAFFAGAVFLAGAVFFAAVFLVAFLAALSVAMVVSSCGEVGGEFRLRTLPPDDASGNSTGRDSPDGLPAAKLTQNAESIRLRFTCGSALHVGTSTGRSPSGLNAM